MAATVLIVEEAGRIVLCIGGGKFSVFDRFVLISNVFLLEKIGPTTENLKSKWFKSENYHAEVVILDDYYLTVWLGNYLFSMFHLWGKLFIYWSNYYWTYTSWTYKFNLKIMYELIHNQLFIIDSFFLIISDVSLSIEIF